MELHSGAVYGTVATLPLGMRDAHASKLGPAWSASRLLLPVLLVLVIFLCFLTKDGSALLVYDRSSLLVPRFSTNSSLDPHLSQCVMLRSRFPYVPIELWRLPPRRRLRSCRRCRGRRGGRLVHLRAHLTISAGTLQHWMVAGNLVPVYGLPAGSWGSSGPVL